MKIFSHFGESGSYLSNVTHQSVKCLNSAGKTAMLMKIQNLSFESYVLAIILNFFKIIYLPFSNMVDQGLDRRG